MTGSTRHAVNEARRPGKADRRHILSYVYHALPYLLVFAMHMGAVLGLLGVFGGSVVERTLMAAALLLAALVLLFVTPSRRRRHGRPRDGRTARSARRTAVRTDDRALAQACRERAEARELARAWKRQYGAD